MQIFTEEVLQSVFNKYVITYQNIKGQGLVTTHLAESGYCKNLWVVKGALILHHFLHKKIFLVVVAT